ncbi:hypothetical protein TrVE_jg10178 [Triparma verrucosa]|uniref:Uncharacterized protein n=1 Tax=Triparma verrucosa TaxID=1606542 RepID=A0A9W7B6S1_9STRA|nr:hypothetical protein TrVE_jg10178 [Triparma verrucosa]
MFSFGKKSSSLKVVKPKLPSTPLSEGVDSGMKNANGVFSDNASPGSWKFDEQAGETKVNLRDEPAA